jgi:hypothetical protein
MFNGQVSMGFFDVYDQYILNILYDPRIKIPVAITGNRVVGVGCIGLLAGIDEDGTHHA